MEGLIRDPDQARQAQTLKGLVGSLAYRVMKMM